MPIEVTIGWTRHATYDRADALRRRFEALGYKAHLTTAPAPFVRVGDRVMEWDEAKALASDLETKLPVNLVILPNGEGLPLPSYETSGSAGMDVRAAIDEPITLYTLGRALVPTGLSFALPAGFEAQVRPRSGLAAKHGISILNAPGTVDSDYRGEVKVPLVNLSQEPFVIERGDRIAQIIIAPVTQARWNLVDSLDVTERGAGGFGSTGRH